METDAMNAIDKLVGYVQKLVESHGEEAVELAGRVYQADALHNLIYPCAGVVVCAAALAYFVHLIKMCDQVSGRAGDVHGTKAVTAGCVALLSGVIGVVGALVELLSPVNWMAVVDPKFALAAALLNRL